jgi:rare lipoprotein A (peptidoglycan hydrolase)
MIKKITFILALFSLVACGDAGYNSSSRDFRYRYAKGSNTAGLDYDTKQSSIRYSINNYASSFSNKKSKKSYSDYAKLDYDEDENYSDEDYSLYKRPANYTGYYKVGTPYEVMGQKYCPMENPKYKEKGVASWYGEKFYGRKTANGEVYNMHDLTAAHRTLPLPSIVKVTNLDNGKSVKVRVNDRGPFAKDRIIDVSKEAAQKLGFIGNGTAAVKVEYLPEDTEKMLRNFGLK